MVKKKQDKVILGGMEGVKLRLLRAREKEKKQEEELYEREHPELTEFKKDFSKVGKRVSKKISKALTKKLVSRKILKPSQMTITIKKQEPYSVLGEENKFFKPILEQEKRSMFFS